MAITGNMPPATAVTVIAGRHKGRVGTVVKLHPVMVTLSLDGLGERRVWQTSVRRRWPQTETTNGAQGTRGEETGDTRHQDAPVEAAVWVLSQLAEREGKTGRITNKAWRKNTRSQE